VSGDAPHVSSAPEPVPLRCPRCGSSVAPEQDWCLECGAPARTRLAPTPNWRLPIAALALVVALAGLALALAFNNLTQDDGTVSAATTAPAQPNDTATTQVPTAPPATATDPGASAAVPASP
jgi:hypothetical protein